MALPGFPVHTTFRTVSMDLYGVMMCGGPGCDRGWAKASHKRGRVARNGVIHWDRADMRANRRGTRNLFKLLALALNRDYWTEPNWKKLYLQNAWARKEIRARLHYNVRLEWTMTDRRMALQLLAASKKRPINVHKTERNFYMWVRRSGYTLDAGA